MDKILLEIVCPATSKHYDFWISKQMKISVAKSKIISEIREYEKNEGLFGDESKVMLFCENEKVLQDENRTVEQSGVQSGDCLMLI